MIHKLILPCEAVKDIVSSLKRLAFSQDKGWTEGRQALTYIKLDVTPRENHVDLVAVATDGYVVGKLQLQSELAEASDAFTMYFQPFPYRPGRANVSRDNVTFTFDDESRESKVTLITMSGSITYSFNCKAVVDEYARFTKVFEGLYEANSKAENTTHYVDPLLLRGVILSSTEIYRKSMKLSIPKDELSPIEVATVSAERTQNRSTFSILQLPIRGEDY